MACELCRNEKSLPSDREGVYAIVQDGKFLVCEDAKHESCAPGNRWVNVTAMFNIKVCPVCGDIVKE